MSKTCFSLLLLASMFVVSKMPAQHVSQWLAENARPATGGGMALPDKKGGYDCEISDPTGVTIGDRPKGGSDAKSLVFSGEQTAAFRSNKAVPAPVEGMNAKVRVNLAEPLNDGDMTIFRHGTSWELRYLAKRGAFLFIVWQEPEVTSEISIPAQTGEWNEVELSYSPEKMDISVGGRHADTVPKGPMYETSKPQAFCIGASAPKAVDGVLARAFRGSLADMEVNWR